MRTRRLHTSWCPYFPLITTNSKNPRKSPATSNPLRVCRFDNVYTIVHDEIVCKEKTPFPTIGTPLSLFRASQHCRLLQLRTAAYLQHNLPSFHPLLTIKNRFPAPVPSPKPLVQTQLKTNPHLDFWTWENPEICPNQHQFITSTPTDLHHQHTPFNIATQITTIIAPCHQAQETLACSQ